MTSSEHPAPHVHAPKVETFDLHAGTNTDPKGFVRPVDTYRRTDAGLYMARPADHPRFGYVESWLLPELALRVTDFHFRPGEEVDQDFYVDIMTFDVSADDRTWRSLDLYLDITCKSGEFTLVHDADEIALATATGVITAEQSELALTRAFETATAVAARGHDLMAWLRHEGFKLEWSRR